MRATRIRFARRLVMLVVSAVLVASCSEGIPDEYSVLDTSFVAPPGTSDDCSFGQGSQLVMVDPIVGTALAAVDVPYTYWLVAQGETLLVPHGSLDQQSGVIALDPNLNIVWQSVFPGHLGGVPGGRPFESLDDGRLLMWGHGRGAATEVVMASVASGEPLLEFAIDDLFTPPRMLGDVIIAVDSDDNVHGVIAATGEEAWVEQLESEHAGGAVASDGYVFLPGWEGAVLAIDQEGKVGRVLESGLANLSDVIAVEDGIVYVAGDGAGGASGLAAIDLTTGVELWSHKAVPDEVDVEVVGDLVVFARPNQGVQAVERLSGETRWQFFGKSAEVLGMASALGRVLITAARDDDVHLLAAIDLSASDSLEWDRTLPGRPTLRPTVVGESVLVGGVVPGWTADSITADDQGWLIAVSLTDGSTRWTTVLREAPREAVAVEGGVAIVTADVSPVCF